MFHTESLPPTTPVDVLLMSAIAPELRGFRDALGERLDGVVGGLRVTSKTVGVGLSVAGVYAAKRAFQLQPKAIIFVGTCGAYPGAGPYYPNDVLVARRVLLADPGVLSTKCAFPDPMQTTFDPHPTLTAGLLAADPLARAAVAASSLALTTDDNLASSMFAALGVEAENMEVFSVAQAAAAAQIPFAAVLGVANSVGAQSREQWRTYERQAAIAAARVVLNWLHTGADGLPESANNRMTRPTLI